MKNRQNQKLVFTGERLIPEINKGAPFYYEHLARYLFSCQLTKQKTVLDIGCGSGYGSYILSTLGEAKKVYALDISESSILYAKNKYAQKKIDFQIDNAETLLTIHNKKIDIAISFELIEHLYNQEKFLSQVRRVLKEGGIFFVSTPNKFTYEKDNPFHVKEFYPIEFSRLLKKFFKNINLYYQTFEMAQLIKHEDKINLKIEENFTMTDQTVISHPVNIKNSQFILAVCSNYKLPELKLISLTSSKVGFLDLSIGLVSLNRQFNHELKKDEFKNMFDKLNIKSINKEKIRKISLKNLELKSRIKSYQNKIDSLESILNNIKSAKFFRLWQSYCKLRDSLIKK